VREAKLGRKAVRSRHFPLLPHRDRYIADLESLWRGHDERRAERWPLLGVIAIVARVWTYHRWYDDLLLLLPLIALFRLTRQPETGPWTRTAAGSLFRWIWAFLLASGVPFTLPSRDFLVDLQVAGWPIAFAFLVVTVEFRGGRAMQDARLRR